MEDQIDLTEKERVVLLTLIKQYIDNNEPIGSRTLSKKLDLGSPATIRNLMADLEDKGFLTHPHTSAGRVPTEKGYRFYVNEVIKDYNNKIELFNEEHYFESILISIKERTVMLSKISTVLSELSHYVGIVLAPCVSQLTLKHIDFVNMGGHNCLVIFVSQSGLIFNRMVNMGEIIPQEELDKMAKFVNEQFLNMNLSQIKQKITKLMSSEKILYDDFIRRSIEISKEAISHNEISDIYLDGRLNIIDQLEFLNLQKMRSLFAAFEKKENLIKIMNRYRETEGIKVLIGSENIDPKMADCSIVMSPYKISPSVRGMLGVIGPVRMRYLDAIKAVERISSLITRIVDQSNSHFL